MNFSRLYLILLFVLFTGSAIAQMPGGGRGQMGGQNMNLGHFYGKIIDSVTNKPIEAASVQLIQNKLDTITKKRKDVVVGGMLTTKKGEFSIENLPIMASFKLKISAIGYKTYEKKIAFERKSSIITADSNSVITKIAKILNDNKNVKVEISGHTDSRGEKLLNKQISQDRATSVMQALIELGINKDRLSAIGYGEEFPIAKDDENGLSEINRRVEFKVIGE